jgi:uncharacterized membrane protein YphA (DoxX/SURF4 family)
MKWLYLARPLLAAPFIVGGLNYQATAAFREDAARRLGIPTPQRAVQADAVVKLVAGAMLTLGVAPRQAAAVLALDLIPTTVGAHRFWEATEPQERERKLQHVMLNCAILGGLIAIAAGTSDEVSTR